MTRDINSAPLPQNGFVSLGSSLPLIYEADTRPPTEGAILLELGISPALINSQATSLALETMSNRLNPVPCPIKHQTFAVHTSTTTKLQIQSLTPCPFKQNPLPSLILSPAPQPLTHQASNITYLGSGQQLVQAKTSSQRPQTASSQHQDARTQLALSNHLPPPPPRSTPLPLASEYQHPQVQHH
ncbi:hypothetical protein PGT21_009019 [Puccinia graminis f. sp. tritici]|uniref:Uncharacterized protein n=1 Tax=Puccinia graminis f. sp. tritici TaxID=56615 RepID=A0A5B0PR30_PUCGR|nr:hypothetical protein PGT21_009019 [Puccinia graminis f. sp. tritici]